MKLVNLILAFLVLSAFVNINANALINNIINDQIEFIENRGQFVDNEGKPCPDIKYICFTKGQAVYLRDDGISFVLSKNETKREMKQPVTEFLDSFKKDTEHREITFCRSDINFYGSNTEPEIYGVGEIKYYRNYYLAHYPNGITNVPVYDKVKIKNVYENIDILFYGNNGDIEYDFIINPGGNPDRIELELDGFINKMIIDNADLLLENSLGKITKTKPVTFQGDRQIESSFVLSKDNTIHFNTASYDKTQTLIIDPMIKLWGTYIGGTDKDACNKN